jgi:hypothetical protein
MSARNRDLDTLAPCVDWDFAAIKPENSAPLQSNFMGSLCACPTSGQQSLRDPGKKGARNKSFFAFFQKKKILLFLKKKKQKDFNSWGLPGARG